MKKIIFFFSFVVICLFLAVVFFPKQPVSARNLCLWISGTVMANNWPGGTVEVGCGGNTLTAGCTGEIQTINPGGSFSLTKCGCSDNDTGKCLALAKDLEIVQDTYKTKSKYVRRIVVVANLPSYCTSNLAQIPHCGSNGISIAASPVIDCALPTPTPTPPCPLPPQVSNIKVTCETCDNYNK